MLCKIPAYKVSRTVKAATVCIFENKDALYCIENKQKRPAVETETCGFYLNAFIHKIGDKRTGAQNKNACLEILHPARGGFQKSSY